MADYEVKGAFGGAFWIDLLGPAIGINPPGAESDPDRDPATGWWLFDATATELLYQSYQLPHGFVEGSTLSWEPHVHWHKSTSAAGTVAWRLRYRYANPGQVWTAWSDPITVTTPSISDGNTAEKHALTTFGAITIPYARISCCIACEIARVGSGDTYDADAVLTDADAHVWVNAPGSVQMYTKYRTEVQVANE